MSVRIGIFSEFDDKGIKAAEKQFQKMAKTVGSLFAGRELLRFTKSTIDAASDLAEVQSKSNVIFGDSVDLVQEFASKAAKAYGQSERAALEAASSFGVFGKAAGLTNDELAKFSTDLSALASDMASFSNTTTDEAIMALGAALRGESEPIRRYGVMLDDATLKAKAFELGIYSGTGTLTTQQKVLAANAAIFEQTSDAQGDFARTSEGVANQQRILLAEFENVRAEVGQQLIPIFKDLLTISRNVLGVFNDLPPALKDVGVKAGLAIGGLVTMKEALDNLGVTAGISTKKFVGVALAVGYVVDSIDTFLNGYDKEVAGALNQINTAIATGRWSDLRDAFINLRWDTKDFSTAIRDVLKLQPELGAEMLAVANAAGVNDEYVQELRYAYTEMNASQLDVEQSTEDVTKALLDAAPTYDEVKEKKDEAADAARDAADALREEYERLRDLVSLQLTAISSELGYKDQVDQTAESINEYNKLQTEIITGKYEGADAARELAAAERDVYNEAIGNAEAAVRWAEEQATLNGENLSAADIHKIQVDELQKVADSLAPGSPLRIGLEQYISKLENELPKEVATDIALDNYSQAFSNATRYREELLKIPRRISTALAVTYGDAAVGLLSGRLAAGGPVSAGRTYLVGEEGPELFTPSTSGMIVPNHELVSGAVSGGGSMGGGSVVLNVTVTNPVASGEQLANELAAYTRRNGTRWLAGVV